VGDRVKYLWILFRSAFGFGCWLFFRDWRWQNFLIVSLSTCAFLLLCEFFTPKPLEVPAELVRRQ